MKRIVCGYDGSDQANDALRMTADLSKATGAELVVAVIDEYEPLAGDIATQGRQSQEYFLARFDEAAKELGDVQFEQRVGHGSVPGELDQIAETDHVDALVIGSTHLGTLGQVLPGSVGDRLLAGAPCAVGIAPKGYAQIGGGLVTHIGVAYDGQAEAVAALDVAVDIARGSGADLKLIAVNLNETSVAPGRGGFPRYAYIEELDRYYHERIAEGMSRVPADISATSVVLSGDPAEELAGQSREFDLFVMGSRGYGPVRRVFLGGVAHEVVKAAACPLLIMPRSAAHTNAPSRSADTKATVA